jgi:hypothetical protein
MLDDRGRGDRRPGGRADVHVLVGRLLGLRRACGIGLRDGRRRRLSGRLNWSRSGLGRLRGRSRRRRRPLREQRERVDVALLVRRHPDAEVDVRRRRELVSARPDRADDLPLDGR